MIIIDLMVLYVEELDLLVDVRILVFNDGSIVGRIVSVWCIFEDLDKE